MEEQIREIISAAFAGAIVRAFETGAGWIIEVVHPDLNAQSPTENANRVVHELDANPDGLDQPFMVWRIFTYREESLKYSVMATLHTQEPTWENGIETVLLSGLDAYLLISEFDAEIMTFDNYAGRRMNAVEAISAQNTPIMPYQGPAVGYTWVETLGGHYSISAHTWVNERQVPRSVSFTLQ